ncbi:hypothetical protein [Liquorilactobacillus ghanensis]|nr:hypothetical protein [Liquorilactobacillus ghanensis]
MKKSTISFISYILFLLGIAFMLFAYGSMVKWIAAVVLMFLGILTDPKLPLYKATLGKMMFFKKE